MALVQRTGWGKSAVYFVATSLLHTDGAGPTLIISPLLALMRDQIAAAERLGLRAHTINSTNRDEWDRVRERLAARHDRPAAHQPRAAEQPDIPRRHAAPVRCVGRPAGDRRGALHIGLGPRLPPRLPAGEGHARRARADVAVLGTTATANDRVVGDVVEQLATRDASRCAPTAGRSPARACASRRSNCRARRSGSRGSWSSFPSMPGSGIVYTLTKRDAEQVATFLSANGIVRPPTAGSRDRGPDRHRGAAAAQRDQGRRRHQRARHGLRQGRPDFRRALPGARLGGVLLPAGRPRGRGVDHADVVLLRGGEDRSIQDFFIEQAFPARERVRAVLDELETAGRWPHDPRADERGEPWHGADRGDAEDPRRGRCGQARRQPLARGGGQRLDATTPSATSRSPRYAVPSRPRWRRTAPTAAV